MSKLRLAIVGAGPAGIYAADLLIKSELRDFDVSIDLFDLLPAPYGLVRYGVAPDHPRIKGIIRALYEVLDRGDIRFFGNVQYGKDITLDELKQHYNAVIFATGAVKDADLNIPGIDLEGSFGAAEFVNWYDAHPDFPREWPMTAKQVAVIGNGNVALDVARVLAKLPDDMLSTDIPANVYEGLKASLQAHGDASLSANLGALYEHMVSGCRLALPCPLEPALRRGPLCMGRGPCMACSPAASSPGAPLASPDMPWGQGWPRRAGQGRAEGPRSPAAGGLRSDRKRVEPSEQRVPGPAPATGHAM